MNAICMMRPVAIPKTPVDLLWKLRDLGFEVTFEGTVLKVYPRHPLSSKLMTPALRSQIQVMEWDLIKTLAEENRNMLAADCEMIREALAELREALPARPGTEYTNKLSKALEQIEKQLQELARQAAVHNQFLPGEAELVK